VTGYKSTVEEYRYIWKLAVDWLWEIVYVQSSFRKTLHSDLTVLAPVGGICVLLLRQGKPHDADAKVYTYRNLWRHRTVLPALARFSCSGGLRKTDLFCKSAYQNRP